MLNISFFLWIVNLSSCWLTGQVTFCESSNNLLIFADFLMKFEDDITYQTLKLEKKGGERDGYLQGFFKRLGFDRGRHINYSKSLPRCCIQFGAWIYPVRNNAPLVFESRYSGTRISNGVYPTLTQRGMAVKSMSSPGSIQGWPLEVILKRVETAFWWEYAVDSTASLCNNGVYRSFLPEKAEKKIRPFLWSFKHNIDRQAPQFNDHLSGKS